MKFLIIIAFGFSCVSLNAQFLIMETGDVSINHTVTSVVFSNTFVDPVVIAQPASFVGGHEATVRLDNITSTGFDLYLEESVGRDGPHTIEEVHYIVVEKGRYTFSDGTMLEAGVLNANNLSFQTVSLLQTYPSTPAIFTQIQTDNFMTNFLKTRQRSSTTSSFQVKLEREQSLNSTLPTGAEEIGYFAISQGGGNLNGVTIEVGSFTANHAVTTQNFTESFSAGNHIIASIATTNDSEPCNLRWTALNTLRVRLLVHEDVSTDGELVHSNETIDYLNIDDNGGGGIYLPVALPIELVDYNLEYLMNGSVELNWSTKSELNNAAFIIEKSGDGQNWVFFKKIAGNGNSSVLAEYNVCDKSPNQGITYYKLQQVDFDGTVETVGIRSVLSKNNLVLYPNPTSEYISIQNIKLNAGGFKVYDVSGNDVTDQIVLLKGGYNQSKIKVSGLNDGEYILMVQTTAYRFVKR